MKRKMTSTQTQLEFDLEKLNSSTRSQSATSTDTATDTFDGADLLSVCGCFLPKERERQTKNVSFSQARIISFPIELGDNPCCEGLPIQMSREACHSRVVDIDQLEDWKQEQRNGRSRSGFKLHFFQRQKILKNLGYTVDELANALDEIKAIRRRRLRSIRGFKLRQRCLKLIPWMHRSFRSVLEKNPKPVWLPLSALL